MCIVPNNNYIPHIVILAQAKLTSTYASLFLGGSLRLRCSVIRPQGLVALDLRGLLSGELSKKQQRPSTLEHKHTHLERGAAFCKDTPPPTTDTYASFPLDCGTARA